jgi:hypothetical protein
MRHYELKEVVRKERVCDYKTCDLCGVKGPDSYTDDWESSTYDNKEVVVSVTVKHKDGASYPEGGSGREFHPDICPKCFVEKVLPALRALGIKIEYVDYWW